MCFTVIWGRPNQPSRFIQAMTRLETEDPIVLADGFATLDSVLKLLAGGEAGAAALKEMLHDVERLDDSHPLRPALATAIYRAISVHERLEQHQQNEFGLRAVFESAQFLTELKELDYVLFEIVERGRRLLGSGLAWLAGLDPKDGSLRALAFSGVYSHEFSDKQPPPSAGVAGHVLKTRSSFTTHNYMADTRFEHSPESDAMINGEGLCSLVAVPLLSGADVIGVLIVGDRYTRRYLPREISILGTLAAHASVAVRNARTFEVTRKALIAAERANGLLEAHTQALEVAADAHEQLTRLLARGAALQDMIDVVAGVLEGEVRYLDAAGAEVCRAVSPVAVVSPAAPDDERMPIQSAVSRSRIAGKSASVDLHAEGHARVAAVMSGDELFGILVIRTAEALTEQAVRIFERSAMATAVLELSAQKKSASQDREVNLAVRAALDTGGAIDAGASLRLERHGLDPARPAMLALIELEKTKTGFAMRRLLGRFRALTQLVTELDGYAVMLFNPEPGRAFEEALRALLFDELKFSGLVCLSGPHEGRQGLAQAYAHARKTLLLLHALGRRDCVVHEAALRMYAVLFHHQGPRDLEAVIDSTVGGLLAYDARRRTRLTDTLLVYLDHMRNARATAQVLGVHVNTLRNRLDIIAGLLGPWETDGRAAEIHLVLRLRRLRDDLGAS